MASVLSTSSDADYIFLPVITYSGLLQFKVRANNDAHIALTTGPKKSDPIYEILLGCEHNSKSSIRFNRSSKEKISVATPNLLTMTGYVGFWLRWTDGCVQVGRQHESTPFMLWSNPKPFTVHYFGIRTAHGADGSWMTDDLYTSDRLEYVFRPLTSNSLHFKVRATNDAHIALTTGPSLANPVVEIFVGGWKNSKSVIRRNQAQPDKTTVDTPKILSKDDFRVFWITWAADGNIQVGKEGVSTPFMMWKDQEPVEVSYFGVCTGYGATGAWIVESKGLVG